MEDAKAKSAYQHQLADWPTHNGLRISNSKPGVDLLQASNTPRLDPNFTPVKL